ncbi:MAG: hypothetical protein EXX96DRAFT_562487 [Benjaminiella poitrasii]|nr:MAG: hypothetical protein EXX96DRAFT_562487 [Benjaminiella poitrasii]
MILITFADEYLGYCLASHLAHSPAFRPQLRLTYRHSSSDNNNTNKPWLRSFKTQAIDISGIDYLNNDHLSKSMRNVDQLILTLPHHATNRLEHCKQVCDVAVRSGVRSILFLSHVGAGSRHHPTLHDYGLMEEYIVTTLPDDVHWTIVRLDWVQQYLHLWSTLVEQTKTLRLPLEGSICAVDITDVCRAVQAWANDTEVDGNSSERHAGQIYTLTGAEPLTGDKMVDMMREVTGFEGLRFQQVRLMDLDYDLRELAHDVWFDERLKRERSIMYQHAFDHTSYLYKDIVFEAPSRNQIQSFLDYFDWVKKTSGSIAVDELRLLIDQKPKSIQEFFVENANSFKPRV